MTAISYAEIHRYLTIRRYNDKIGSVTNTSFPPVTTCIPEAPCIGDCYALKTYKFRPSVRHAYTKNINLYYDSSEHYFWLLSAYLQKSRPRFFRYFVSGDIPNQAYLNGMIEIAGMYRETSFLAFTKRFELDYTYVRKQSNLQVVFSTWPGWNEIVANLPMSIVRFDSKEDIPKKSIVCSGKCDKCYSCWHLTTEQSVIFDIH